MLGVISAPRLGARGEIASGGAAQGHGLLLQQVGDGRALEAGFDAVDQLGQDRVEGAEADGLPLLRSRGQEVMRGAARRPRRRGAS